MNTSEAEATMDLELAGACFRSAIVRLTPK